jgi:hypothetical protein
MLWSLLLLLLLSSSPLLLLLSSCPPPSSILETLACYIYDNVWPETPLYLLPIFPILPKPPIPVKAWNYKQFVLNNTKLPFIYVSTNAGSTKSHVNDLSAKAKNRANAHFSATIINYPSSILFRLRRNHFFSPTTRNPSLFHALLSSLSLLLLLLLSSCSPLVVAPLRFCTYWPVTFTTFCLKPHYFSCLS